MIENLTQPIHKIVEEAEHILSNHFQTALHFSSIFQLSEPDRRNLILRLVADKPNHEIPPSFILKKTTLEPRGESEQEQISRFAHDWAGIEFLTEIGTHHGPQFYGGSLEHQFILIEDLGEPHHSLVGPLTRASSPFNLQEAISALEIYSHRVGQMHADTYGKTELFSSILHRIYPKALRFHFLKEKDISDVLSCFKRIIGQQSLELTKEIEDVYNFILTSTDFKVLLHGDICPDNVYFQNSDMKIIDFEYGDTGHALIDGIYLRMAMPSCWCSKTVPPGIIEHMEAIYRNALKTKIPAAVDDKIYQKAMAYACANWVIKAINWHVDELMEHEIICPSGPVDADSQWQPQKNAFRPRVLSRLQAFVTYAKENQFLPRLVSACEELLNHLKNRWPTTASMEYYPVFRE